MQLEGQRFDHYRVVRLLRSGGMGEVYLAVDEHLQRRVAIKVIWTDISRYASPEEAKEVARLFLREAQAVAQLDHSHILPVYDSGEKRISGVPFMYMVMPVRRAGSFSEWLEKRDKAILLSPREVEYVVKQAADALQHAHDHQIIHQDVKPSNFLLHGDAESLSQLNLQLADFGVAKLMTTSSDSQDIRGTPMYMAPEQWDGRPVPATDQYALAVMAYELLTGRPPFTGINSHQMWYQHNQILPPSPSSLNANLPKELDAVLLRALEKNPVRRFRSISAFAQAFQQAVLSSSSTTIVPQSEVISVTKSTVLVPTIPALNPSEETVIPQRRSVFRWKTMLLTGVVLALIAGSGGLFYTTSTQQNRLDATATASARTAIANTTAMVGINATSTNQANATASSQANATTTAQVVNARSTATGQAVSANTTATVQAANANATATSQAHATVTAQVVSANATATAQTNNANATATAYTSIVAVGTPAVDDSLQDNSQGYNWDTTTVAGGGGCAFVAGGYQSSMPQKGYFSPCFAEATSFSNFSYQVQMSIAQGDQGGIAFRADSSNKSFYYFHINRNGTYALEIYNNNLSTRIISQGSSSAINTGLNQTNLIAVIAKGNNLAFYVNRQYVTSVTDSTYSQGQIGVVAENTGNPSAVVFSDAKVWTL